MLTKFTQRSSPFIGFFIVVCFLFVTAWAGRLLWAETYPGLVRKILVHEVRSKFSHIRIKDLGSLRALYFVRDSGEEVIETAMDLRTPHLLQLSYTRTMFSSFLIKPDQKNCLIVGLGGGAMVQFLNHFFPEMKVDVVEIDPVIVGIARDYFGTRPGKKTHIYTEDAFQYFKRTASLYDVIYMDAFLKPGEATDSTGVPRNLKTVDFLKSLHKRLHKGGLVVFNLNEDNETDNDIRNIREAFPSVYVFGGRGAGNIIVVGALSKGKVSDAELRKRSRALDGRRDFGFSFRALVDKLNRSR